MQYAGIEYAASSRGSWMTIRTPVDILSGPHRGPPVPVPAGADNTAHGVVKGVVLDRGSLPQ